MRSVKLGVGLDGTRGSTVTSNLEDITNITETPAKYLDMSHKYLLNAYIYITPISGKTIDISHNHL